MALDPFLGLGFARVGVDTILQPWRPLGALTQNSSALPTVYTPTTTMPSTNAGNGQYVLEAPFAGKVGLLLAGKGSLDQSFELHVVGWRPWDDSGIVWSPTLLYKASSAKLGPKFCAGSGTYDGTVRIVDEFLAIDGDHTPGAGVELVLTGDAPFLLVPLLAFPLIQVNMKIATATHAGGLYKFLP